MKISIIYWSSTGNTEEIANGIFTGIKNKSETVEVNLLHVSKATVEDIKSSDLIAFGCSAMGVENIDDSEMEPFINSVSDELNNKNISLFGSYDWGDGQWLEDWKTELLTLNANIVSDNLMIHREPNKEDLKKCYEYGENLLLNVLRNTH